MTRVRDIIENFGSKKAPICKEISLVFEGYYLETDLTRYDGKIGVYCA